jgi:4-hydroxybenzoate polyprenyltransferase
MIKIEHSIFALPFALVGALVAANGLPETSKILWIVVAMVAARSCAMAFNRLVDRKYDSLNPRTQKWPLAAGLLSVPFVSVFVGTCCVLFVYSAYRLNPLAFVLSPLALVVILGYSFTKRFTALSHWFIGLALSIAPVGAWIAIRGTFDREPVILGLAILFWVAGFDLIYSCQDAEFDRSQKLHSVPARFGIPAALLISRMCHIMTVLFLLAFGAIDHLGWLYFVGVALVAALLVYEHSLVSPRDLRRVNEAFFTINGAVGVLLLFFTSLDLYF